MASKDDTRWDPNQLKREFDKAAAGPQRDPEVLEPTLELKPPEHVPLPAPSFGGTGVPYKGNIGPQGKGKDRPTTPDSRDNDPPQHDRDDDDHDR